MKFKTSAKCGGCVNAITNALKTIAPAESWEFDLTSPDKTLTYVGAAVADEAAFAEAVVNAVATVNHKAERID